SNPLRVTTSTLSPYTTLFRSRGGPQLDQRHRRHPQLGPARVHAGGGVRDGAARVAQNRGHAHGALGAAVEPGLAGRARLAADGGDRKSTRLNSSHVKISYAVF